MRLLRTLAVAVTLTLAAATAHAQTKHIMVYGDSISWGFMPIEKGFPSSRYPEDSRWPSVVQQILGGGYEVVTEALNGRTTDSDDPTVPSVVGAGLNGAAYLPAAMASHLPLDLVVIMLGTNDLKAMYHKTPFDIALGAGELISLIQSTNGGVGTQYPNPKILLIAPPPLAPRMVDAFSKMFAGGEAKSEQLAPLYAAIAKSSGAEFLNAGDVVKTDGVDGLHLSADAEKALGRAVAERVKQILQ